jgi:chorismate mutase
VKREESVTACRGVRGATTVPDNTSEAILEATRELLESMVAVNGIHVQDVASAIFTATPDLNAAFPAQAAREIGWHDVPLLSAQEIPVPGALPHTIRILLHWNTSVSSQNIRHIYINGAETLRPDIAARQEEEGS